MRYRFLHLYPVIELLVVWGTDDADEALLLTSSLVDVTGVVVGADGKTED